MSSLDGSQNQNGISSGISNQNSSKKIYSIASDPRGKTIGEILADSGLVNLERMIVDCIPEAASHLVRDDIQCCRDNSHQ